MAFFSGEAIQKAKKFLKYKKRLWDWFVVLIEDRPVENYLSYWTYYQYHVYI